ncbi:hypothetical protein [Nonomuraea sp. NPDC049480]|uniref:hypothetical protein n=1 Tax=Nonomuraea sp. NPDC049480 TaxID=3364353 RepID=UPI003797CA2E
MSAEQVTGNKTLFSRFHEAINSGDAEVIAKTIDELVAPDVLFHTPAPIDAGGGAGAQAGDVLPTVDLRLATANFDDATTGLPSRASR